jgi:hypothetical protein
MTRGAGGRLARFLQPPTAQERAILAHTRPAAPLKGMNLPARIGPVEFSMLGAMVAVRCPANLAPRATV